MGLTWRARYEITMMALQRRLRKERLLQDLSVRQLSRNIGIDAESAHVRHLEDGKYNAKLVTLFRWADALGYDIELHLVEKPNESNNRDHPPRREILKPERLHR